MADTDVEVDPSIPPGLYLISAFLAMEPTDSLISLARVCGGGGLIAERVQRFIWDHCITKAAGGGKGYTLYLKNFVKKLIFEVESSHGSVLDELYEQYGYYVTSFKDDSLVKGNARVSKCISFLFPDGCSAIPSCPKDNKLEIPLDCSLNMLEGDTGCSLWPSSLYLSEFILSFPEIFSNKSCFEVGSGVGLVGICLSHVKASKVILSDGDLSTLANMKLNLELNQLTETDLPERSGENMADLKMHNKSQVKCIYLPWESATESELRESVPDIVLGADIIYDPSCLPHLVRVLGILLSQTKACSQTWKESSQDCLSEGKCVDVDLNCANERKVLGAYDFDRSEYIVDQNGYRIDHCPVKQLHNGSSDAGLKKYPVAYISSVIRNIDTFSYFCELAEQASLTITDLTERLKPFDLLPYMQSYNRSSIRLFTVMYK